MVSFSSRSLKFSVSVLRLAQNGFIGSKGAQYLRQRHSRSTQRSLRSRPGIWRQCYSPLVRRGPDVDAKTSSGRGHQRATPRYFLKLCFHDQADRFAAIPYEAAAPANIRPLSRRHRLFLGQSRCHRGAFGGGDDAVVARRHRRHLVPLGDRLRPAGTTKSICS